jgi:outer membrane protein OmpA-like peptidoglycan-associated protein
MKTGYSRVVCTLGLMSVGAAAWADSTPPKKASPQEPAGFVTGAVIGGFAAGPIGAVVGAGVGTWLGSRVHRASDASKAEKEVAALQDQRASAARQMGTLENAKSDLEETNRALTSRLDELAHSVEVAQYATDDAAHEQAAQALDGLQGEVLFRTGSVDMSAETLHEIQVLGSVLAKSPALTVRLDGYADPRGTDDANMKLSEARADAVRAAFLSAGVPEGSIEVNAYGKSRSTAEDSDGYALERRVQLTVQAAAPLAQANAATSAEVAPQVPATGEAPAMQSAMPASESK